MVRSGKNGELHLKQISYYKQTGGYHPTTLASERSGIRRAAQKFIFKDNKLFYVGKDKRQMRLVILSDEDKRKVLKKCHENHTGTHHGISRTLTLVESQYYWTSVTNDVKQWVNACQHCQVGKNTPIVSPRFPAVKAVDPWTILNVDLMGPFGATNKNHMYVILLIDVSTKWAVILPLCDLSATEVAKAVAHVSFCYGPPQKIVIAQKEEFVHQINGELFEFFGMKQLIVLYCQTGHEHGTGERIRSFLLKYCVENSEDWDDHLEAIAYAFNLIHSEKDQNTPYFQMFKRNANMSSTLDVVREVKPDCLFARIVAAVEQAEKPGQESTMSSCQDIKKMTVNENKGHIRKKPKQLNPFHLKVGHEVLRQRKNWWKDGSFRSEWVGPCIIDYITENGSAMLRDASGSRLKRPIKIVHLKPYVRGSQGQDSGCIWQTSLAVDHDYIGLSETATEQSSEDTFSANGQPLPPEVALLESDLMLSESKSNAQLEFTDTASFESTAIDSEQWSVPYWTLQSKTEAT